LGISLDTLNYFDDDGIVISKRSVDANWEHISGEVDVVVSKVNSLETEVNMAKSSLSTHQSMIDTHAKALKTVQSRLLVEPKKGREASIRPAEIAIAMGVVVACAVVALVVAKKWRRQQN